MKTLYLITARGGSKGVPGKNVREFLGLPLVCHAIKNAREAGAAEEDICLSTDSAEIAEAARNYGLEIPFMRPDYLASDTASSYDVIIHALDFYHNQGRDYDRVVLLQPTSPLRNADDILQAVRLWRPELDMVVSVCNAKTNPYYNAFETDEQGMLHISKGDGRYTRRQDAPEVLEYNGAVYVMSVASLRRMPMSRFSRILPYRMDDMRSIDIDTEADWTAAENIAKRLASKSVDFK